MSAEMISMILNILLAVFVVYGLLWGLGRGGKKSLVRFIYFIGFVTLFALLSPIIAQALLGIEIPQLGGTLQTFIQTKISEIPQIATLIASGNATALLDLIAKAPAIIVNLVLFIVLVILAKFFSWIGYSITWRIHFKNKKPQGKFGDKIYTVKDGKPVVMTAIKEKKYRWAGAAIGAVQGFILMFLLFLPITGIVKTAGQYIDTSVSAESVYAEDAVGTASTFQYAEISDLIKEALPNDAIEILTGFKNSLFSQIGGVGNFDLLCFDSLSTITVGGERVTFRTELNTVANIAESVLYVMNLSEDATLDWEDLDFDKLETSIEALFDSGLVKSVGMELLSYYLDMAIEEELFADSEFNNEIIELLTNIRDNLGTDDAVMSQTLKNDVLALVGIAKAVCESGLMDAILDEETPITVDIALDLLVHADENYIEDIFTSLFSSTSLQTVIVTGINIGLDKLSDFLTEELEDQGTDVTGENAVTFDTVTNASIEWEAVATEFSAIVQKGLEIYSFYDAHETEFDAMENEADFAVIMADEDFTPTFLKIGQILDTIQGTELLQGTVGGEVILEQVLYQFNRINEINQYVNLEALNELSWASEMQLVANFFPLVEDMLSTEDIMTFDFKSINYAELSTNISAFFGSTFAEAIKIGAFEEELTADPEFVDMKNAIFADKTYLSDFEIDIMPFFNGMFELCKAGLVEFVIAQTDDANEDPFSPESVEAFLADIRTVATDETKSYLTKFIENVLSSDITKYMTAYGINYALGEMEETGDNFGDIDTGSALDLTWENFEDSALDIVNNMLLVYDNLVVSDNDPLTSDLRLFLESMDADPFEALLNEEFATTNGTASLIGEILDSIANLTLWDYVDGTENANIYENILTKYQTDLEAYVDVDKILNTTSPTFWKEELTNLAPAIMLLKNTPVSDGDPLTTDDGNLLTKLVDGSNILDLSEFRNLTQNDTSITTIISALKNTKIMNSFAIDFFNEINKAIVNLVDEAYDTDYITSEMVLSDQTTTIKNVIKTFSAMLGLTINDFADVLSSANAPSAQAFLIALQASHTASGIFDYAYTAINGEVADLINDINSKVRTMLGQTPGDMAGDDLASDFANTAKVLKAFEALKDITPFDLETLVDSTNRANTIILLNELQIQYNADKIFSDLYEAITTYLTNPTSEDSNIVAIRGQIGATPIGEINWQTVITNAIVG